ncbi:hypothetical protein HELRODRAFT_90377, partial [Helobdella robusta]|uniref:Solute carrier family 15 member 1 n=1 Tax=Helobdella robusta TaxID=6412 RepID=T1G7Q3_HELRO
YPFHVFLILANEFCERFSFYGMRAILVIFLWKALNYEKEAATAIYHTFIVLCYFSPVIGAMIADGWLGKYSTILYVSIFYALGNIVMTLSAFPINGHYTNWLAFVALVVIGFGTGGIKPCVSSFGGDQFTDNQVREKESFFSLFYLSINIGSLISTILIPYIRGNVYCFEDSCYSLCFGIPAILMISAVVVFSFGTKRYTRHPAGESILMKFAGCIVKALGQKCCCGLKRGSKNDDDIVKKNHWLDYAAPDYDQSFINDVKDVVKVAWLFIPLPVFWALFDQQGSKWTLQAQQMNGEMSGFVVLPDMISFLNPSLVVMVVPLLEYLVYPCFEKMRIPLRPLQKMSLGMFLAAVAFLMTGFLQIAINTDQPVALSANETKYQIVNTSPRSINVSATYIGYYKSSSSSSSSSNGSSSTIFFVPPLNVSIGSTNELRYTYAPSGHYRFTVNWIDGSLSKSSLADNETMNGNNHNNINKELMTVTDFYFEELTAYQIFVTSDMEVVSSVIKSKNGPLYILVLANNDKNEVPSLVDYITEIPAWSINIFMQAPQYVVITVGECLFSVTGLSFTYTQAPASMKSILTSIWLLTVGVGNVIIIIVQGASGMISQVLEFFLFSCLMLVTTIIFIIMSYSYVYVTNKQQTTNVPNSVDENTNSTADDVEDDRMKKISLDAKNGDVGKFKGYGATEL